MRNFLSSLLLLLVFGAGAAAQSGRTSPRPASSPPPAKPAPAPAPAPTPDAPPELDESNGLDEDDVVRIDTQLVTVPVIVRDQSDRYVPDMRKEEFTLFEDNVEQPIAFFSLTSEPFHVVLLLDTSGSTEEKLRPIKNAASSFITQLQPADKVKVISFDDAVRSLCEFTGDRAELQRAIARVRSGEGTKLYDAMRAAVSSLLRVKGRKAVVIFTDGVDSYSDSQTYRKNIRALEETGIIVYPIRYDTRADLEERIRRQRQGGTIDLGTILGGGRTGTPPTAPGGTPAPMPTPPPSSRAPGGGVIIGLPGGLPGVILPNPRRDPRDPNDPRNPRYPDPNDPRNPRYPDPNDPNSRYPAPNDPRSSGGITGAERAELDLLYRTADAYLRDLAETTGGSLYRADTLGQLPAAFDQIAAELRTQYALSYYPSNKARDGKFRKIKVKTTRPKTALRARPGYRTIKS
jgi:hypothetical protein